MRTKASLLCAVALLGTTCLALPLGVTAAEANAPHRVATVALSPDTTLHSQAADAQIRAALDSLVGTQTPEELATLASLEGTTILYDWESGVDLAAVQVIAASSNAPAAQHAVWFGMLSGSTVAE